MTTHNHYPTHPAWQNRELSDSDGQYVREELDSVPHLTTAFKDLGDGLNVGSSRTIYNLPVNQFYGDGLDAMIGAARIAAEVIYREGIEELTGTSLEMRVDELPEQFEASALPGGIKGSMSPDTPIGYVRAENTENGLKASVGALNPQAQTHYALPLN